jgi:hypothetical protein
LFGFKAFGDEITAAYPCWAQNGDEIQFVLYISKEGKPCIDNDWIREDNHCMYTNEEPIIVSIMGTKPPSTFQQEVADFFGSYKSRKP